MSSGSASKLSEPPENAAEEVASGEAVEQEQTASERRARRIVLLILAAVTWIGSAAMLWPKRPAVPRLTIGDSTADRVVVDCSPDGKLLFTYSYLRDEMNPDDDQVEGPIELWSVETGELVASYPPGSINVEGTFSIVFSPDSRLIAHRRESDDAIVLFDRFKGESLATIATGKWEKLWPIFFFSPDGKTLAYEKCLDGRKWICLFDLESRKDRCQIDDSDYKALFSADSRCFVAAETSEGGWRTTNRINIWDAQTGEKRRSIGGFPGTIERLRYPPDGTLIVSWCVRRWVDSGRDRSEVFTSVTEVASGRIVAQYPDCEPIHFWRTDGKDWLVLKRDLGNRRALCVCDPSSPARETRVVISGHSYRPASRNGRYVKARVKRDARFYEAVHKVNSFAIDYGLPTIPYSREIERVSLVDLESGDCFEVASAEMVADSSEPNDFSLVVQPFDDAWTRTTSPRPIFVYDMPPKRSTFWVVQNATLLTAFVLAVAYIPVRLLVRRRVDRSNRGREIAKAGE